MALVRDRIEFENVKFIFWERKRTANNSSTLLVSQNLKAGWMSQPAMLDSKGLHIAENWKIVPLPEKAACEGGLQCTMPIRTPGSCHVVSTFNFSGFLAQCGKDVPFCEDKKLKAILSSVENACCTCEHSPEVSQVLC